ncbi:MAG: glycosyltransferase, partial [Candidatus Doudnabacteria bacterium]|nr:glycosyltransferase [Candidatus Doudnabacteria bacterium]
MISIITSLYKSDKYLPEFKENLRKFASELTVAGVSFEVIVIANEATKEEENLAKEFSGQNWFRFINVPRESLYATWNRGVREATGELLGFWNVDDVRFASAILEAKLLFEAGAMLVHFPFYIKRYLNLAFL